MFMELSQDAWAEAIHTNLLGVALCCRAALLSMLQAGHGRIVTLSSRVAAEAVPGHSAYSVSKAAAMALTQGIAAEIDRNRFPDILINDLIPGMTRSKMNPAGQDPHDVYPFARQLVTLPPGGPSGQVFFQGRPIDIWSRRESFMQKIRKRLLR
jgi:NAD(P)-dependent dehydrogenase (short-subunit alcohol dehydrogenase family)